MYHRKTIAILTILLLLLTILSSVLGIQAFQNVDGPQFTSLYGEHIQLYGYGIYAKDSVSVAVQGIASDIVTLFVVVPATIFALLSMLRKSLKGTLVLTGMLGYFLYTYTSYTFLWMYNPLFLVYVAQMSLSFFAFVLLMMSFDIQSLRNAILPAFPRLPLIVFMVVLSILVAMMWLGRIIPAMLEGVAPLGLEHYTTLVIQALDLGFVIPASLVTVVLLVRNHVWGYFLGTILIFKYVALLMAISAMVLLIFIENTGASMIEGAVFIGFTVLALGMITFVFRGIRSTHMA
ncbi:MAG TPA: hypothetical protein DIC19_01130 [Erysipelotrichaceae bacterium]|nr:hypothetical protein [Erysipelotrichaceae bacterium]